MQKKLLNLRDLEFTLCNSSKNRNENLEKVIPLWRSLPFSRCIIIDWNSDDHVWWHLNHLMDERFTVVRVENEPYYWSSIIHNFCISLADTPWIFRIDSDVFPFRQVMGSHNIRLDQFYIGGKPNNGRGTEGTAWFKKDWWEKTGGYDERQIGYGYEDVHFYKRMADLDNIDQKLFPKQSLIHIEHGDEDRLEYRDIHGVQRSSDIQGNFDYRDWDTTCKKYAPEVYTVYGQVL